MDAINWSGIIQLKSENLKDVLSLEDEMIGRMKKKEYAHNYVRYRSREKFEELIKSRELYGMFDNSTGELEAIEYIKQQDTGTLLDNLKDDNGKYLVSEKLINVLKPLKGCRCSCLMTRLKPSLVGLGKFFTEKGLDYTKNVLGCDFQMGDIHVRNASCYRLYKKYLSIGCASKVIKYLDINAKEENSPIFFMITSLNKDLEAKIADIIKYSECVQSFGKYYMVKNNISDVLRLDGSNICIFEGTKIKVYKLSGFNLS